MVSDKMGGENGPGNGAGAGKPRKRTRRGGRPRLGTGSAKARRKAARLAAVQALYQIDLNGVVIATRSVESVIAEFVEHRLGQEVDGERFVAGDPQLFADIVRGACHRRDRVDELIVSGLDPRHHLERLEMPLRATLRAGAFELFANLSTHARILITEYVDVAVAFYGGREPAMVNAVLDKVGRILRPEEMEGAAASPAAEEADDESASD